MKTGRASLKNVKLTFHGSILAVIIVVLLGMSAQPLRQLFDQQQRINNAREKIRVLTAQNQALEIEKRRLNDPAYIEVLARRDIGLVRPGETSYVAIEGRSETKKINADEPKQWYENAWETVVKHSRALFIA